MGFFDFLKQPDINQGIKDYESSSSAVLLDVRTPQEYRQGRIPGSRNLPLQNIDTAEEAVKDKDTPLFVYCQSGGRSKQAVSLLQKQGYTNVTNIGGISSYQGKVVRK